MAQKIFWSWLDDDLTFNLSRQHTGLFPEGLYRGFDFVPTNNMTITLGHGSSGFKRINLDQSESNFTGLIITKQGVIIQEDEDITLNLTPADPAFGRWDLIVAQHIYSDQNEGGQPAVYFPVTGIAGPNPVKPSVINPITDIPIGYVFIPALTTALNAIGVVYEKVSTPSFSNDLVAYLNRVNRFTKMQQNSNDDSSLWTYDSLTKKLTINDTTNDFTLNNTVTEIQLIQPVYPAGTLIKLRLGGDCKIKHNPITNGVSNILEPTGVGIDRNFKLNQVLILKSNGTLYQLIDYSSQSTLDNHNLVRGNKQDVPSTNVLIVNKTYTAGFSTFNMNVLKLNPDSNILILDLDNLSQIGSYDPINGAVGLYIDEPTNFIGNITGFRCRVHIKTIAAPKRLRFAALPQPGPITGTGTGFILISNYGNYAKSNFVDIDFRGGDVFDIIGNNINQSVRIESVSKLEQMYGNIEYAPSIIWSDGDSHKQLFDKLNEFLTRPSAGSTVNYSNLNDGFGDIVGSLIDSVFSTLFDLGSAIVHITVHRMGNMRFVSGTFQANKQGSFVGGNEIVWLNVNAIDQIVSLNGDKTQVLGVCNMRRQAGAFNDEFNKGWNGYCGYNPSKPNRFFFDIGGIDGSGIPNGASLLVSFNLQYKTLS